MTRLPFTAPACVHLTSAGWRRPARRLVVAVSLAALTALSGCAKQAASDVTDGVCVVSGIQRQCHKSGTYKNIYHLNGQHAGTCACQ